MSLIAHCHCGATRIELPGLPSSATQCNCTFCNRTGAVWAYYQPDQLTFLARDNERVYSTNPDLNQHYFCGTCGMQTWGESPDWASMYNADGTPKNGDPTAMPTARIQAMNLRLVDDLDWSGIKVEQVDGRHNW